MKLTKNNQVYFDDLTHTYLMGGKELTGVTTLMKLMGVSVDYGDIPQDVLDHAAARGSAVHKTIEAFCKGREYEADPEFAEESKKSLNAYKELNINALENEYLVSDNETIASSIDIVMQDDEASVSLIDIKTTTLIHKEAVAWQLSIYKHLFLMANPAIKVNRLYCLHIRDGVAKMVEVAEVEESEVQRLLTCFKNGEQFTKTALTATADQEKAVLALEELEKVIVAMKAELKRKEAEQEQMKGVILDFMRSHNKDKWEVSDVLSFTRVAPSTRATIDSTRLKKEMPDIYKAFLKESITKESLRINIKNS